jgi:hypothetical protein
MAGHITLTPANQLMVTGKIKESLPNPRLKPAIFLLTNSTFETTDSSEP